MILGRLRLELDQVMDCVELTRSTGTPLITVTFETFPRQTALTTLKLPFCFLIFQQQMVDGSQ